MILLCKLLLAPGFVVLVTLAVRRFGPKVGGLLGGLPVVAGPILFIYAIDHGTRFAADAARNSLAALVALTAFVLVVAFVAPRLLAPRRNAVDDGAEAVVGAAEHAGAAARSRLGRGTAAWWSVVAGWVAFCAVAAVVGAIDVPPVAGLLAACAAFTMALAVLPHADPHEIAAAPRKPPFDLGVRAVSAAVLVIALTSLSGQLGPAASGVLAPFPTITSVLAGFAVAHESRATTLHLLRGMLRGFFSFAAALFVLAVTLRPLGTAGAFLAAIAATTAVQLVLLTIANRAARAEPPASLQAAPEPGVVPAAAGAEA